MKKTPVILEDVASAFPPYPVAVKAGELLFISGLRPGDAAGFADLPEAEREQMQGYPLADLTEGQVSADSWAVHSSLEKILAVAGTRGDQVLRQHIWQRDKRFFPSYEHVRAHWQPAPAPSSGLGVTAVVGGGRVGCWIGIDAIAACPQEGGALGDRRVLSDVYNADLPSASHYSQAIRSGPFAFLAGHIAIKTSEPGMPLVNSYSDIPEEGRFLATGRSHPDSRHGPVASQAWYIYNEIRRTLESHGMALEDVVHATVFLGDLRDFSTFHRVHAHFFPETRPSLCVVGFDEVGHRGTRIEIEVTVMAKSGGLVRQSIPWSGTPPFAAPAVTRAGPLVFFSGAPGVDDAGTLARSAAALPEAGRRAVSPLEEGERRPGLAAQCWMAWEQLRAGAAAAGMELADLVKTTVYLSDPADRRVYEAVRETFLDANLPAFECVIVHGPGPISDALVQIEAIGMKQ